MVLLSAAWTAGSATPASADAAAILPVVDRTCRRDGPLLLLMVFPRGSKKRAVVVRSSPRRGRITQPGVAPAHPRHATGGDAGGARVRDPRLSYPTPSG